MPVAPNDSESHLGQVGGEATVITVNPTTSATPDYAAGDSIGGKIQLENALRFAGGRAILQSLMVLDRANAKSQFEVLIFDRDPTAATLTDNAAIVLSTNNAHVVARVTVITADYLTIDGVSFANLANLGRLVQGVGTDLWVALLAAASINYGTTSELQLAFGFLRD